MGSPLCPGPFLWASVEVGHCINWGQSCCPLSCPFVSASGVPPQYSHMEISGGREQPLPPYSTLGPQTQTQGAPAGFKEGHSQTLALYYPDA